MTMNFQIKKWLTIPGVGVALVLGLAAMLTGRTLRLSPTVFRREISAMVPRPPTFLKDLKKDLAPPVIIDEPASRDRHGTGRSEGGRDVKQVLGRNRRPVRANGPGFGEFADT